MSKTTKPNLPTHRIIGNVRPDAEKPYWVEFGGAWPLKSNPEKVGMRLALKFHSTPNDPNVVMILVPNDGKANTDQQEMAV